MSLVSVLVILAWSVSAIGYDAMIPIADNRTDVSGSLYKLHQPYIYVSYGCVPFPAVSEFGEVSDGLNPVGWASTGCSKSVGQLYTRAMEVDGYYGIMYSIFVPKDQSADNWWWLVQRTKYTWVKVVVWLSQGFPKVTESLSYWDDKRWRFSDEWKYSKKIGERPLLMKSFRYLGPTDYHGGEQPMVHWEHLPQAARDALEIFDFGVETWEQVPFNTKNFVDNMNQANQVRLEKRY